MAEAGAVGFSDDGASIRDASTARRVMERLAELGLPLIEHAEDADLAGDGVMREGFVALRMGLAGWPAEAEVRVVERDIAIAEETGARLHVTHLSTGSGPGRRFGRRGRVGWRSPATSPRTTWR